MKKNYNKKEIEKAEKITKFFWEGTKAFWKCTTVFIWAAFYTSLFLGAGSAMILLAYLYPEAIQNFIVPVMDLVKAFIYGAVILIWVMAGFLVFFVIFKLATELLKTDKNIYEKREKRKAEFLKDIEKRLKKSRR